MDVSAYMLLITAIIFGVAGQLLLKHGMSRHPGFQLQDLASLAGDLAVISGFLSYGISTLFYIKALSNLDLSLAYPTISLGYVMVVILSRILFKERFSPSRWVALLIICAGVALVGFGGR